MPASPVSRFFFLLGLALVAACVWVATTRYEPVRSYRQYLTEDRKNLRLPWSEISSAWSEEQLKTGLKNVSPQCYEHPTRAHPKARLCHVKLRQLNGVPTMYANFLFADDKLQHVATAIPWWAHEKGLQALLATLGQHRSHRSGPTAKACA